MRGGDSVLALAALRLGAAFFLAAFGFAAVSLATSLAGTATATPLAFAFGAFLARAGFLPGPFAARSASSDTAWSSVSSSGLRSRGTVALIPPCFT